MRTNTLLLKVFTSNKLTKQYNFQSDIKDRKLKNGFEISTVLQKLLLY